MGRGKNNFGLWVYIRYYFSAVQPACAAYFDIKKDHVRFGPVEEGDGIRQVIRLPRHLELFVLFDYLSKQEPDPALIFYQ